MLKRIAILSLAMCVVPLLALAVPASRQAQWKKVQEAMDKGLPRTAIEHLEPIIASAIKEKAYPEAIKAICRKIALEGNIQGNRPEEKITRLQAEMAKAPLEMLPVMESILANWYWHYFQQNRWRILHRTTTAEQPSEDLQTWDLPRIFTEIDKHFTRALASDQVLKKIPVSDYDDLLEKGNVPDAYRPTMYDFVAHNALAFYSIGEQAGARAEDAYDLPANSPIFAPAEEFLKWTPQTTDTESRTVKAIKIFKDLLGFHQQDQDKTAFLDADLHRLRFGYNKAVGEEKNSRYKDSLKHFVANFGGHETSALALFQWASVIHGEGNHVEARKLAAQGLKAFPDSIGGKNCYNLIQQIEAKSITISTERVWNDPWPVINVNYRNINRVHFRAVAWDFTDRIKSPSWRPEYLTEVEQKQLLAKKPVLEWAHDLPVTQDYKARIEKLPVPKELKPGFYFLLASHEPNFGPGENVVTYSHFWVSKLAIVSRVRHGEGLVEGFVLDAKTGTPIANATVECWQRTNNNQRVALQPVKTDQNGLFRFIAPNNYHGYLFLARHGDQALSTHHEYYLYHGRFNPQPHGQTIFFTDRAIYRPGQTVHYKGISIWADQNTDTYKVLADQNVTVVFQDANGKEIARQRTRTNDYGSFSGSFTAPSDRVMGQMTIRTDGYPEGATSFSVEEYKRPKFQTELEKPKVAAKLNSGVTVTGKATAYTGAPIDNAKVRYRVYRQVRYPDWWLWYYYWQPPKMESQEIAHGFTVTGVDGSFKIDFVAKADPTVPEKDEPIFRFTVSADVTDSTGETRTGQTTINVGYTALRAQVTSDGWHTRDQEVKLNLRTTTLDDEPQQAEAVVRVYRLKQPDKVQRKELQDVYHPRHRGEAPPKDLSNPNAWELGEVVFEKTVKTDDKGQADVSAQLDVGAYRAIVETKDRFGKKVTAKLPLQVLDPAAKKLAIRVPNLLAAPKWSLEPGSEFTALWGTGYDEGRAYVEVEHRHKLLQSFWTEAGQTQQQIRQAVNEAMRGGFTVRVTYVRENRAYVESRHVEVPWSNKDLKIRWETFTSKLEPGQKVQWTAVITGPDAQKAVAEMVATLYDESLDQYRKHDWMSKFNVFRQDYTNLNTQFENHRMQLQYLRGRWPDSRKDTTWTYRHYPHDIAGNFWGWQWFQGPGKGGRFLREAAAMTTAPGAPAQERQNGLADRRAAGKEDANFALEDKQRGQGEGPPPAADIAGLAKVSARKNLNETAFFFPHLLSIKEGEVRLQFTMPEALTRWKFLGFAHDKELRSGILRDSVVTARELMVQPHPPRFLREGDVLEFTVKVSNQSDSKQNGTVRLTFNDARTGKPVDDLLSNVNNEKSFEVPAKESRSYSWKLKVPDGIGYLTYKAVAAADQLSDGEEGYLPVLTRRVLVTESLPLPLRGPGTKKWDFARLRESGKSDTLRHQQVTVQMVSNPNWYAIMALPYLMEYPYQCSEQIFNRLYANALARHIATSDPKIKQVFEQWKGTPALDSPLEKNRDLVQIMLEETPWLRQAQRESQARRNVAILFDDNRLNNETARALQQLAEMQLPDGAWPWFPGGRGNDYITLYITTGFGRLRNMGVNTVDLQTAFKAINRLDNWIDHVYREIVRRGHKDKNNLSPTIALYLYGRSFYLQDRAIAKEHKEAVDYFIGQAKTHWLKLGHRQSQGHLALALHRFGEKEAARGIMASIKERAVTHEELGMFWRDLELQWWWFRAPIETQALMIEAFHEVLNDTKAVEECQVWLLKQKQTQDWKTTRATADACYALLLRGGNPLASDALVEVTVGDIAIKPEKVEAGTGFYEKRFLGSEVKPDMGTITTVKTDKGVSWGSVHWQYLEDVSKVTPYEGTPLKLKKSLYTKVFTKKGPVLEPVRGSLKVGDELVVRIELRVDRDMEYVHLKDHRGSGTEPVNVLSRYRFQDGLAYYEMTRDTASHFFIDYLPKGTYVFEYATRVQHRGTYQTGMASIQCMYAPEFNSHSESHLLVVE